MIRNLFLPDTLFTKKILSIEIGRNAILIAMASFKKGVTSIEKIVSAVIDINNEKTHEEQVLDALNQIFGQLNLKGDYHLRIVLPNNQVFFKEITVPFLDRQKISLILGYEIESSLPFSLSEALVDFVITKQDQTKKESTLVVGIAQKKTVDFYFELIKNANTKIAISTISVDLLNIYNLCHLLYQEKLAHYQIILELGKNSISLAYLWQGELLLVRNLPYGMNTILSKITNTLKKSTKDIYEILFRFGLEPHDEHDLMPFFSKLFSDINFTLRSFNEQVANLKINLEKINLLIIETTTQIKNIDQILSQQLQANCHILDFDKINKNKNLIFASGITASPNNLSCIANTLTPSANYDFNILPETALNHQQIRYQIITAFSLTLVLFAAIYGLGYFKINNLNQTLLGYQRSSTSALKSHNFRTDYSSLTDNIAKANEKVYNERKLWFSFSNQTRYSTLKYLQILSNAIDMQKINLDLTKLIISDNTITIKGSVKEHDDLYTLEQALASVPIFANITKPQEKEFTLTIMLKPNEREF